MLEKQLIETELTIILRPNPGDGTTDLHRGWQRESFLVLDNGTQIGGIQQSAQTNLDGALLSNVLPDRADLVAELAAALATIAQQENEIEQKNAQITLLEQQAQDRNARLVQLQADLDKALTPKAA